jgi:hypothetical protein
VPVPPVADDKLTTAEFDFRRARIVVGGILRCRTRTLPGSSYPDAPRIEQCVSVTLRRRDKRGTDSGVLFDPTKVDLVATAPDGMTAELYIVADAPWTGSDAQIRSLQDKIHNYVGFAVDGQMAQLHPELASIPWRIVVRCLSGRPDGRTADVLARTVEPVRGYGGELEVRL